SSVTMTLTPTPFFTGTDSPTATMSVTITASYTATLTPTPTFTFTITASPTCSITVTPTFTATPSFTITTTMPPTPTATCTITDFCFSMLGIFPNPFSTDTTLVYKVCLAADVEAVIYTVSGEVVRRLHQQASPGWNSLRWDGKNDSGRTTASGVFIYSIEAVSGDERNKFWGKVAAVK
ncbi:MAG: FlgD immunoglobulin-like domain containing protein, partial [Candidatus Goldiibacteriota bacterium]